MSRYQGGYSDSPGGGGGGYSDNANYGNSYANGGGGGGGYSDEPAGGYARGQNSSSADPMSSQNPYAASGSNRGYASPKKSRKKLWIILGVILAIIIIVGAVVGGVVGSRASKNSNNNSSSSGSNSGTNGGSSGTNSNGQNVGIPSGISSVNSAALTATASNRVLAVATNSKWMLPVYATGTATAGYAAPTSSGSGNAWPSDPSPPSNTSIRGHPRIGAPQYKWDALTSGLIASNPYFNSWNATIVGNASATLNMDPVAYTPDGGLDGSGVLDVAREMKVRVKNWAYAYRVTNETAYANRVYRELVAAAGNDSSVSFGADGTRWNPAHFLDLAEFCATFAIGYDWLYDYWSDQQRDAIMWSIINLGLSFGEAALTGASSASNYSWWTGSPTNSEVNGNWNCVNNAGLTLAALAIQDRDPTGIASRIIALTVPNAAANCFQGAQPDGTWAETANYWYFGNTGAAELVSALTTSYGDDRGLLSANPAFRNSSYYHMYVQGMTSLFNYGDHGPNKYSATANSLLLWGNVYNEPRYSLYQRDQYDASEPWSMFWYDPAVTGTWWDGLQLDKYFSAANDEWATGRSSWSDNSGAYWAMKSGKLTGHQTHGDLDIGDFVLDAMNERWFGELGSGQYLSTGYFSREAQDSQRWLYYRKRTDGQNTLYINYQNQNVNAQPSSNFGSTGTAQGLAPSFNVSTDDTAFFTTDMSSAYNSSVKRGIRFLNGRKQILLQDDISGVPSGQDVMWRAHTNATVSINSDGNVATLTLNSKTLTATILSGPSGAKFSTMDAVRLSQDPAVPSGAENADQPNDGVTVLVIDSQAGGSFSIQVLFNPQWPGVAASSYVTPGAVGIDSWSLTSHN